MATDGTLPADHAPRANRGHSGASPPPPREASAEPVGESESGDQPEGQRGFNGPLVQEAEAILQNFREGKMSHDEAVGQLFITLHCGDDHPDHEIRRTAFQQYCGDLKAISELEEEAGETGRRIVEANGEAHHIRSIPFGNRNRYRTPFPSVEDHLDDVGRLIRKRAGAGRVRWTGVAWPNFDFDFLSRVRLWELSPALMPGGYLVLLGGCEGTWGE